MIAKMKQIYTVWEIIEKGTSKLLLNQYISHVFLFSSCQSRFLETHPLSLNIQVVALSSSAEDV